MVSVRPFKPNSKSTVSLAVTATTGNVRVQTGGHGTVVRVYNQGANTAYIEMSNSSAVVATTTTGMPLPSGAIEKFECPMDYLAAITSTSTTTLLITVGEGGV